jgi:hypothetical protein
MKARLFVGLFVAAALLSGAAYAAKKVIFFVDTDVPTSGEKSSITTLQGQAAAPYNVVIRNSRKARLRATPESADYLAGAIPPNYRDGGIDSGTPLHTVYDPTNPPTPLTLVSAQALVRNGGTIHIVGGGTATLVVSGSTATISTYVKPDGGP